MQFSYLYWDMCNSFQIVIIADMCVRVFIVLINLKKIFIFIFFGGGKQNWCITKFKNPL